MNTHTRHTRPLLALLLTVSVLASSGRAGADPCPGCFSPAFAPATTATPAPR